MFKGALTLTLLATLLTPPLAHAALSRRQAQRILNRGQKHFIAGRFDKALVAFNKLEDFAGEIPVYRWNVARCLEELGKAEEAIAAFEKYLTLKDSAENHEAARARIALLEERYLGRIHVTCNVVGAVVKVDQLQDHTRRCPTVWKRVRAGQYHLEAETSKGLILIQEIEIRPGRDQKVHLNFPGVLKVTVDGPPAEVLVDREVIGETPLKKQLPPATYIITTRRGGLEWSKEVKLPGGDFVEVDMKRMNGKWIQPNAPVATGPRHPIAPWVFLGLSAAAAGVGGYYYTKASAGFDDMESHGQRYREAETLAVANRSRSAVESARLDANQDKLLAYSTMGISLALLSLSGFFFVDDTLNASAPQEGVGMAWRFEGL